MKISIDSHGTVVENHLFAHSSRKNPAQLGKIYVIITYKLHQIAVNSQYIS